MQLTLGVAAHVDAGKTTLCEQLLLHSGVLRKGGRVDHGDAFMDGHAMEKARGITIFSEQASLDLAREGGEAVHDTLRRLRKRMSEEITFNRRYQRSVL